MLFYLIKIKSICSFLLLHDRHLIVIEVILLKIESEWLSLMHLVLEKSSIFRVSIELLKGPNDQTIYTFL